MMISSHTQIVMECDRCGELLVESGITQRMMLKIARSSRWSIGKLHLCRKCKEALND